MKRKNMRYYILMILFVISILGSGKAQKGASLPFLLIPPSTPLHGMADSYTGLPTNDPFGFYYNPAQLGIFGKTENMAGGYSRQDWPPRFHFNDVYYQSYGIAFGYNFKKHSDSIPIAIGAGYLRSYLDLGTNILTDEQGNELGRFHSGEWYNAYSLGFHYTSFVEVSVGFTYKSIVSDLADIDVGAVNRKTIAKPKAYDLGALVTLPFGKYLPSLSPCNSWLGQISLKPVSNFSLGMVMTNIGDKVVYSDRPDRSEPLPRVAKIGYGFNTGLQVVFKNMEISLVHLQFASEANDLLVKRKLDGGFEYQTFPGDINIYENVIRNKNNFYVMNRHGFGINILEILQLNYGTLDGGGENKINTFGYTISSRGVAKLLPFIYSSGVFNRVFSHLDISYNWVKNEYHFDYEPVFVQNYSGISLSIFGF